MNRIRACLIHAFIFFTLVSCSHPYTTKTKIFFGTTCTLSLPTSRLEKYFSLLEDIDNKFSYRKPNSEISRINDNAGIAPIRVSDDVYNVIKNSIKYSKETEGAFNPILLPIIKLWGWDTGEVVLPSANDINSALSLCNINDVILDDINKTVFLVKQGMGFDLGGIVKGYAADILHKTLKSNGIESGIINLGGNVFVFGDKEFNVAIQKPYEKRGVHDIIETVRNMSVVTSGAYERGYEIDGVYYHHIINPYSGYPAEEIYKSVTIISDCSELCDVYATAIFIKGVELKNKLLKEHNNVKIITQ